MSFDVHFLDHFGVCRCVRFRGFLEACDFIRQCILLDFGSPEMKITYNTCKEEEE